MTENLLALSTTVAKKPKTSLQLQPPHPPHSQQKSKDDQHAASSSAKMYHTGSAGLPSIPDSPLATRWLAAVTKGAASDSHPQAPTSLRSGAPASSAGARGWGSDPPSSSFSHPLLQHKVAPPAIMISNSYSSSSSISSYSNSGEESDKEDDLGWSPLEGVLTASTANLHAAYSTHDLSALQEDPPFLSSKSNVELSRLYSSQSRESPSPLHISRSAMDFWASSDCDLESSSSMVRMEEAVNARRAVQETTFINWINNRLKPGKHGRKVRDLLEDLRDGILLIKLLESLTKKKIPGFTGKQPKSEAHKMVNLDLAFQFMTDEKVKVTGIGGMNIYQGDATLTLGMIWVLIQKYQIKMQGHKVSTKQVMMQWLQALLPKWGITNFTSDWKDGRALLAVINAVKPGIAPNISALDPTKHHKNCTLAIKVANSYLKIPQIISPGDLAKGAVDEVSMMTYLSYFVDPFQAKLLKTVQRIIPQFHVKGFATDWYDGSSFGALTTALFPNLFVNFDPDSPKDYTEELLEVVKRKLGIRLPFKAADLVDGKVEELQIMTMIMLIKDGSLVPLPDEVVVQGKGIKEANCQKETFFFIDASEAGPGKLNIDAFYEEDGQKLKFNLNESGGKVFKVTYTPTINSNPIFNITWSDTPVPGSPFKVPVSDASLVRIIDFDSHSTLVEAGKPLSLKLETKKAGIGNISGYLNVGREKIQAMATSFPDGTFRLNYTPTESGKAVLHIFWNNEELKHLAVTYTVVDVGGYSIASLPKKQAYCIFEKPEFSVLSEHNLPMDVLQMTAVLSLDVQIPIRFTSIDGNIGHASFTPTLPGTYRIEVVCVDQLIKGTPFSVRVADPQMCKVDGEIPTFLQLGRPHLFKINTKEAGVGSITFERPDGDVSSLFKTNLKPYYPDDLQSLEVTPLEEGEHLVGVKYQNHWISNSPFKLRVCDPTKFELTERPNDANVGQPVAFTVRSRERIENGLMPHIKASGPSAKYSPHILKSDDGLSFSVKFIPWEIGEHEILVTYGEFDIPNTPIYFPVTSFDSNACSASGSGLQRAYTNIPAQFTIISKDEGLLEDDTLKIAIKSVVGNDECQIRARDNHNGTYNIAYLVKTPGAYLISIQTAGRHIPGSPFKLNALPGPDADKCTMYGPALEDSTILTFGKPIDFTVDTSKGGVGKLEVKAVGPNNMPARVFVAQTDQQGKYDISIDAHSHGKHRVNVKWSGQHIPSSPFTIKVFPGADARKCIAYGPGLEDGFVGKKSSFTIETKHAGAGILKVRLHGIKGAFKIEIAPVDQENRRTLLANYNPTQPGEYLITIKWSEINVPGSPFRVKILGDRSMSADQLVVFTPTPRPPEDLADFEELDDGKQICSDTRGSIQTLKSAPSQFQSTENVKKHTPMPATFLYAPRRQSTPAQMQQISRKNPKVTFSLFPENLGSTKQPSGRIHSSRFNGQALVGTSHSKKRRKRRQK